ncbi:uncharacterized protein N7496_012330 [Penicillium cataractarum]|uniref:RBR-type E3 ubiquitin transferase n=1 Tax=Penicillium cataractarum TaxID=2100454 RepID=A0A9W9URS8_9EURO|nr:uncharacterized protein N7496_012330 [Penicillium cataractarum]KAJ5355118.1 hypothetical protein N7496_012330 [Penicillium cataractarum]
MSDTEEKASSSTSPPSASKLSPPATSTVMPAPASEPRSPDTPPPTKEPFPSVPPISTNPPTPAGLPTSNGVSHSIGGTTKAQESQTTTSTPARPLLTIDPESAALISQLLHQDFNEMMSTTKGKQPRLGPSDIEVALEEWDQELGNQEQLEIDIAMARSLDRAVRDDGAAITLFQQEEARARADRQLALRLARMGGRVQETDSVPFDGERIYQMNAALAGPSATAGSSTAAGPNCPTARKRVRSESPDASEASKRVKPSQDPPDCESSEAGINKRKRGESPEPSSMAKLQHLSTAPQCVCVACNDASDEIDIIQAPCAHHYCAVCLVQLVEQSIIDESLFPPRCCRMTLPLSIISVLIGPDLTRRYEEKCIERADPEKTYCSNRTCSAYILPDRVSGYVGTCGKCQAKTCTICKRESHKGRCRTADDDLLDVAAEQNWQRCRCGHVVELNTGCNHITCRCGYEFCYACAKRWKTCECATWDETRLVERAEVVAARQAPQNAQVARPAAANPQAVQRVVNRIRQGQNVQIVDCGRVFGADETVSDQSLSDVRSVDMEAFVVGI